MTVCVFEDDKWYRTLLGVKLYHKNLSKKTTLIAKRRKVRDLFVVEILLIEWCFGYLPNV
jgi:hypothetical protein